MKFILLNRLTSLWTKSNNEGPNGSNQSHQKAVRFEDCERINRERFKNSQKVKISTNNQVYAALSVNILAVSVGASIGWTSPSISHLQSQETPLDKPLTSEEIAWLGGLLPLGALLGTVSFAWLSEKFGRFWMLWLTAFPQIFSWLFTIYASVVEHLYVARFAAGLCMGGTVALIPVYISEITNSEIRGTLNSLFLLSMNFGTLMIFIIGNLVSYDFVSKFNLVLPILFAVIFLLFPETPYYLLKCGKNQEAEKALKFLCGCRSLEESPDTIRSRLIAIASKVEKTENARRTSSIANELKSSSVRNSLLIGIVLVSVNQLCGCFAFINYASDIFMRSGSTLSPSISSIIIAVIQLAGSIVSVLIMEKMSRKLLYSLTCCVTILGLLTFGTHGLVREILSIEEFNWVPIVSMSVVVFAASIGILPLTFTMLSELLAARIRSFGVSFCTGVLWFIAFLLLRLFPLAVEILQLYNCMFIFCGITFFGMIFVIAFVPETRNKSAEEIEKQLR